MGVIYILKNPSFPDYVKIGYADNLEQRLKQLNRAEALPFAFRAYATYETDKRLTDVKLHELIDSLNPDLRAIEEFDGKKRSREFYAMSAEDAYKLLECIAIISGTKNKLKRMKPEGHEILDEEMAAEISVATKRGPFRFSAVDIPVGATIHYINDESITAKVVDDRHIEYKGVTTSMSAVAAELLGTDRALQGTLYFTYEGERLTDRRERMEK